jgi:membrane protein
VILPWSVQAFWRLLTQTARSGLIDYAPSMGEALAYYTLFSLAPLLLIVVAVAGLIFGQDAARGEMATQLSALMGAAAAKAVQDLLSCVDKPVEGSVATAVAC